MPREHAVTLHSARSEAAGERLGSASATRLGSRPGSPHAGEASSRQVSVSMEEPKELIDDDDSTAADEPPTDTLMVHDAALYTEVLDASDWTEVLRREKRRKKREALAQHSVEEANERDRRDALRKKAAEDAKAVKEARKKLLCAAREERETAAFRERNDDFFIRHNALLSQWEPIERTNQNYRDRVREQIYRRWEREVFLPTQREINRKVEAKCASDTRPHLFNKAVKASMDPQRKGSGEISSGDLSRSRVPLTWKERKDELWRSFLNESNRKSKMGGRAGLFLDVIDEVEYDPIAQRQADTIRYKKRTLPTSDADQHRMEAQQLELQYAVLGLAYRDQERKSCTGILRERQKKASCETASRRTPSPCSGRGMLHDTPSLVGRSGSDDDAARPPTQLPPSPPLYQLEVHRDHNIPHTHVPFDFAKQFRRRAGSPLPAPAGTAASGRGSGQPSHVGSPSLRQSRLLSGAMADSTQTENGGGFGSPGDSGACGKNFLGRGRQQANTGTGLQARTAGPVDRSLALASISGEGAAAKAIRVMDMDWQQRVSHRQQEEQRRQLEDRHQSPLAIAAQQKLGEQNILECDRLVMPLPLKPTPAPPTEQSKHLLPWMTNGSKMGPINERAHYLPVKSWGKAQLKESVYGHYVYPDGSLRPPPDNKQEGGYRIHDSNVSFDHFNFPKENESTHTGKRMCVYYQSDRERTALCGGTETFSMYFTYDRDTPIH
eukprot:gene11992-8263_t